MLERRQHHRIPVNECCVVCVENPDGTVQYEGVVTDVSEFGLGIHLDTQLPTATAVTILLSSHWAIARVVYCKPADQEGVFCVGLAIEAESEQLWSFCRHGLMAAVEASRPGATP